MGYYHSLKVEIKGIDKFTNVLNKLEKQLVKINKLFNTINNTSQSLLSSLERNTKSINSLFSKLENAEKSLTKNIKYQSEERIKNQEKELRKTESIIKRKLKLISELNKQITRYKEIPIDLFNYRSSVIGSTQKLIGKINNKELQTLYSLQLESLKQDYIKREAKAFEFGDYIKNFNRYVNIPSSLLQETKIKINQNKQKLLNDIKKFEYELSLAFERLYDLNPLDKISLTLELNKTKKLLRNAFKEGIISANEYEKVLNRLNYRFKSLNQAMESSKSVIVSWWKRFGEVAIGFTIVYRAFSYLEQGVAEVIDLVKEGIRAFDDYTETAYKSAMFITMFSNTTFKNALNIARKNIEALKLASIDSFSSLRDIVAGLDEFAQHGVFISDKLMKAFVDFSDFVALVSKTTGSTATQVRQEIQSLFEGTLRAGNTTLRFLKNYLGDAKFNEFLQQLRSINTATERVRYVITTLGSAMRKVKDSLFGKDLQYTTSILKNQLSLVINYALQLASITKGLSKDTNIFAYYLMKYFKSLDISKIMKLRDLLFQIKAGDTSKIKEYKELAKELSSSKLGETITLLSNTLDLVAKGFAKITSGTIKFVLYLSALIEKIREFYNQHKQMISVIGTYLKLVIAIKTLKWSFTFLTRETSFFLSLFLKTIKVIGTAESAGLFTTLAQRITMIGTAFLRTARVIGLATKRILTRLLLPMTIIDALFHPKDYIKLGKSIVFGIAKGITSALAEIGDKIALAILNIILPTPIQNLIAKVSPKFAKSIQTFKTSIANKIKSMAKSLSSFFSEGYNKNPFLDSLTNLVKNSPVLNKLSELTSAIDKAFGIPSFSELEKQLEGTKGKNKNVYDFLMDLLSPSKNVYPKKIQDITQINKTLSDKLNNLKSLLSNLKQVYSSMEELELDKIKIGNKVFTKTGIVNNILKVYDSIKSLLKRKLSITTNETEKENLIVELLGLKVDEEKFKRNIKNRFLKTIDDTLSSLKESLSVYKKTYKFLSKYGYSVTDILGLSISKEELFNKIVSVYDSIITTLKVKLKNTKSELEKYNILNTIFGLESEKKQFIVESKVSSIKKTIDSIIDYYQKVIKNINDNLSNPLTMDLAFKQLKQQIENVKSIINQLSKTTINGVKFFDTEQGKKEYDTLTNMLDQLQKKYSEIQKQIEGGKAFFRVFARYQSEIYGQIELTKMWSKTAIDVINSFTQTTSDILYDFFTGRLKSFKSYVQALTKEILRLLSQVIAEMIKVRILSAIGKSTSTYIPIPAKTPTQPKSLNIGGLDIGKYNLGNYASKLKVGSFAEGGIVTKPTLALIGEAGESEAVIPLSKFPQVIGSTIQQQPINVVLNISALDSQSFIEWERKNKVISSFVRETIINDLQNNGTVRHMIKKTL